MFYSSATGEGERFILKKMQAELAFFLSVTLSVDYIYVCASAKLRFA
jgi:hypothetical protein